MFLWSDLITNQVFLPSFEVRWNWNHVSVHKFLKVVDSESLEKILWYAMITSSHALSTANRL